MAYDLHYLTVKQSHDIQSFKIGHQKTTSKARIDSGHLLRRHENVNEAVLTLGSHWLQRCLILGIS